MLKRFKINIKLLFFQFIKHRNKYISDKNFLIIASLIVGVLAGLAAVSLKTIVHAIQHLCEGAFDVKYQNYLYLFFPLVGILLSVLYLRIFHYKTVFDKGLSSIIYAISKKASNIESHKMYSHVFTSALTVGFGGSVGLEAPIAVTGSAIGSNTGKEFLVSKQERTLLLAAGAAAGIAAVFNSPIAGVIFAFEVLLTEVSIPAFIPLLMASAAGAVVSKLFYTEHLFFLTTSGWSMRAIPYYLALGLVCGLLSVYMMRCTIYTESVFHRYKRLFPKAIAGGIIISVLIFLFPPLYGEGYGVIGKLMSGESSTIVEHSLFYHLKDEIWFLVIYAIAIILIKVFAAAITVGSGGNGGIFGPSLFNGALCGFAFAEIVNATGLTKLNQQNFVAVAMCGLISGVLHAPLTAIFLIAEITGGYSLFVPLMLVSATSYFMTRAFEKHSIYTKTLVERGFITLDKDKDLLDQVELKAVIEKDFVTLNPQDTLRELVKTISSSKRNIFPVVDRHQHLRGVILLDDVREMMFREDLYDSVKMLDLLSIPPFIAHLDDDVSMLMSRFEELNIWNIPVVDEKDEYLGFISKTGVLNKYRQKLIDTETES